MRGPVGTADQQRFGGMESEKYRDTAARQARPARGGQRDQPRHRALVFRERELRGIGRIQRRAGARQALCACSRSFRPRPHGLADAGDGRLRGGAAHPRVA